jgi:hypothetical protein
MLLVRAVQAHTHTDAILANVFASHNPKTGQRLRVKKRINTPIESTAELYLVKYLLQLIQRLVETHRRQLRCFKLNFISIRMTGSSEEGASWANPLAAAVAGASALASSAITYLKGDPRTELMTKQSEAHSDVTVVNSDEAIETGPAAAAPPAPADGNGHEGDSAVIAPEAKGVPLLDADDYARQLEAPFLEAFDTAPTFYVRAPGKHTHHCISYSAFCHARVNLCVVAICGPKLISCCVLPLRTGKPDRRARGLQRLRSAANGAGACSAYGSGCGRRRE